MAAEAKLELARLKAPRELNDEQVHSIARKLATFKGRHVTVGASPATFEATNLANRIMTALSESGLLVQRYDPAVEFQLGKVRGLVVAYVKGNPRGETLANALTAALVAESINATTLDVLMSDVIGKMTTPLNPIDSEGFESVTVGVGDKY